MKRDRAWSGACNVRDLGGLPIADGGSTAFHRVFRSGSTSRMTDAGWAKAIDAGVSLVIDLRNLDEHGPETTSSEPSRMPRRVNRPVEDQANVEFMQLCDGLLAHPRSYPHHLGFFAEEVGAVFEEIARTDDAVMFNCSAGRDRTGLITAMLLRLNGVSTETIVEDYELGVRGFNQWMRSTPGPHREPVQTDDELTLLLEDRLSFLAGWIDGLDVPSFLGSAGVDHAAIETLSRRLH